MQVLEGHKGSVRAVAFAPHGDVLASGGTDDTVRLWELAKGTAATFAKLDADVEAVAFAPDGSALAVGTAGGAIRVWKVAPKRALTTLDEQHKQGVRSLAWSPDG